MQLYYIFIDIMLLSKQCYLVFGSACTWRTRYKTVKEMEMHRLEVLVTVSLFPFFITVIIE
jgi:hypothetical protein